MDHFPDSAQTPMADTGLARIHHEQPAALSVLFVDPDAQTTATLAAALGRACVVTVVSSAREAAGLLREHTPDLIVTELELPDMDGTRFVEAVHAHPQTRHVLLMVVTWRNTIQGKIAALQAGADDVLIKPVEPGVFVRHVQMVLRFRRVLHS